MSDSPLDRNAICAHLIELADELGSAGPPHSVVVVGGSLLALRDLRAATADVDSISRLDEELTAAIAAVGARHGLSARWLNDSAAMFRPFTFNDDECEVILRRGRLQILGAPLVQVFLMKLYAARAPDYDDLVRLWPLCDFVSAAAAVDEYYLAYPHLEHDPYLVDYVRGLGN